MKIKEYVLKKAHKTEFGSRLIEDKCYRVIVKSVLSLVFNLLFAFYNGILGALSSSLIFIASSVYYLLLSAMRFTAMLLNRKGKKQNDRLIVSIVGVMLIILSIVFHMMVIVSMKYKTAALYGTVTMIAIATFTFTKITMAVITAVKHNGEKSKLFKAVNAIRYSEVAVSLLTMQQSMFVSFENTDPKFALILNVFTGAAVFLFILSLGIFTIVISKRKEE